MAANLVSVLGVLALSASADIIKIQNINGSPTINFSQISNGSFTIANIIHGSPSAGSINVINNSGHALTSLILHFSGLVTSNQFLNCQFGGAFHGSCAIFSPSNANLGSTTGKNLPQGSYSFVWTFNTPIAAGAKFNIEWSILRQHSHRLHRRHAKLRSPSGSSRTQFTGSARYSLNNWRGRIAPADI